MEINERIFKMVRKFICTDRLHKSCIDRFVGRLGIHRSQHMLLMHIAKNGYVLSQKELAKQLDISAAAVTVSIKKLANDGYIEKVTDGTDNRFNRIAITEKGKETIKKSKELFAYIDSAMCSELSEADMEYFEQILDKMTKGLKKLDEKEMHDI